MKLGMIIMIINDTQRKVKCKNHIQRRMKKKTVEEKKDTKRNNSNIEEQGHDILNCLCLSSLLCILTF
jgi:hypothetical protein